MISKQIKILVLFVIIILFSNLVFAADCGDGIKPCACGDTLVASHIMDYDLIDCPGNGIIIGEEGLTLDCNGHIIDGMGSGIGINLYYLKHDNYIKNCTVQDFHIGIDIYVGDANKIYENIIQHNNYGARIFDYSGFNKINKNIFKENNQYGLIIEANNYIVWGDNEIWNNSFVNNGINAYETYYARENYWNIGRIGNYWSDFESNEGYPFHYHIPGSGDGIDYRPFGYLPWCGDKIYEDYVMTHDIMNCPNSGLIIGTNDITLDCNGYLIDGDNDGLDKGVYLNNKNGTAIKDCDVKDFYYGIVFDWGFYGNVSGNTVTNSIYGISLSHGSNNNLSDNVVINNTYGIYLLSSLDNVIDDNDIFGNIMYGVYLVSNSENNTFWNNNFTSNELNANESSYNNSWNLGDVGNYWSDFASNPGYPDYYEIPGLGDGIDYKPLWDQDNDNYNIWEDCNDNNPNINPGMHEQCRTPYDDNCNGQINENCEKPGRGSPIFRKPIIQNLGIIGGTIIGFSFSGLPKSLMKLFKRHWLAYENLFIKLALNCTPC